MMIDNNRLRRSPQTGAALIERIYVHNYRCFENFTLDLAGRKSALIIGKNGSGKSTLRHVFGLFRSICRGPNHVKAWINSGDFSAHRIDAPMRFELTLRLAGKQFHYGIAFEYLRSTDEVRILSEDLSVEGSALFSRQRDSITLSTGAAFTLNWHVAMMPLISEKPGDGSVAQLRSFLTSMILLSPIPGEMCGLAKHQSFELDEDAGNFAAWLSAVLARQPARYNDILNFLKFAIPDIASFDFAPGSERGIQLNVSFESEDKSRLLSLDFKNLSDGEKSYFLSGAIVAANRSDSPVFCFWDEPDSHLALPEIGHFITQLRRMANHTGQFVATSHNGEAIRRFSDENTIVFMRKSHLEPTIGRPLAELKYSGDLIEALIRDEVLG